MKLHLLYQDISNKLSSSLSKHNLQFKLCED